VAFAACARLYAEAEAAGRAVERHVQFVARAARSAAGAGGRGGVAALAAALFAVQLQHEVLERHRPVRAAALGTAHRACQVAPAGRSRHRMAERCGSQMVAIRGWLWRWQRNTRNRYQSVFHEIDCKCLGVFSD
jgi:hypothetical protein